MKLSHFAWNGNSQASASEDEQIFLSNSHSFCILRAVVGFGDCNGGVTCSLKVTACTKIYKTKALQFTLSNYLNWPYFLIQEMKKIKGKKCTDYG